MDENRWCWMEMADMWQNGWLWIKFDKDWCRFGTLCEMDKKVEVWMDPLKFLYQILSVFGCRLWVIGYFRTILFSSKSFSFAIWFDDLNFNCFVQKQENNETFCMWSDTMGTDLSKIILLSSEVLTVFIRESTDYCVITTQIQTYNKLTVSKWGGQVTTFIFCLLLLFHSDWLKYS